MKLLRLSYCDYQGAGAASLHMVERLRSKGVDAKLIVLQKTVDADYVIGKYDCTTVDGKKKFNEFAKKKTELKHHIAGWPVKKYCYFDLQLSFVSARKILKMYGDKPDIISVGWVTDFVSTRVVRRLQKLTGAKVIYSMVDNAPITGGCHYPWDCEGYKHCCYPCPALRWHFHLSQHILKFKKRNIRNDVIITGTTNDCNRAAESVLFRNCTIVPTVGVAPNPFSFPRRTGRDLWNIGMDRYVIFVGASFLSEERKGLKYLSQAFNILKRKCSVDNILILLAGEGDFEIPKEYEVKRVGTLGTEDLFKAFCCSDLFVCPSVEDSGPMMINYAFGANIPVVCFKMGVALDLIRHKENGYIAELFNSEDLAEGIEYWYGRRNDESNINLTNRTISAELGNRSFDRLIGHE